MKSSKCLKCGLVNFAAAVCKRCGSPLTVSAAPPADGFSQSLKSEAYTRGQEICIGCIFLFLGLSLLAINWYTIAFEGEFSPKMTIVAPIAICVGLMLFIFPYPDKEKFPDHDLTPKGWLIFILIGAIIGFWNYFRLLALT